MSKKKNLKLAVLIPLLVALLVLVVYFSIPFISKQLIENKLPANVQLIEWDMKLLSFSQLCIKQATFKIDLESTGNEVSVKNACFNYFSKNIEIEKIVTKTQERLVNLNTLEQNELFPIVVPPIFLPKVDLSLIQQLSKIGYFKIASLQSQYSTLDNARFNLLASNIVLDLDSDATAKFSIKQISIGQKKNSKTKQKIFTGRLSIKADSETIEISFLDSNHKKSINLEFNQTLSQRSLDLTLSSDLMLNQLRHFIAKTAFDYLPSDSINLEIIRDLGFDKQLISLSTKFKPSKSHAEPIAFKLDLLLINLPKTNQVSVQIESELDGKPLLFEKLDFEELDQVDFNKIASVTNIKLSTSENKLEFIDDLSSVINIDQLNILKTDDKTGQVSVNFDKLKISINSNRSLPLNSFKSLIETFSVHGKIAGEKFSSKFMSDDLKLEIGKTDFDDEPTLSLDFEINGKNNLYRSSGHIRMSDFLADIVTSNKIDYNKSKKESIKSTLKGELSWNNLSATINTNLKKAHATIHSSDIKFHIEGLDLITSKLDLSNFTFDSDISINDNKMIATGDFDISEHRLASMQLTNKDIFSKDSAYILDVKNPNIRNELISQLASSFLAKLDAKNETSLSINRGTIEHDNNIKIGDKIGLKSSLALRQFDIDINSIFLIGLNYQQKINSLEPLNLSAELDVREVTFASGLLLSNISTVIDIKDNQSSSAKEMTEKEESMLPNISVTNFKASIWNGKIQSKSIIIKNGNLQPSTIDLNNIDLTEMLFFLDMNGLYADGDIDIHLPIEQLDEKYLIENGYFASNQAGIIKYDSGQEQVDVEANIALHALQNFHYKKLDGTINYDKDGAYLIKLHLLGSNPNLYDGYPIDFELNLSGELSDVFQSVFLTGDFEKSIMERAKMNHLNP